MYIWSLDHFELSWILPSFKWALLVLCFNMYAMAWSINLLNVCVFAEMMEDSHFNSSYFWSPVPTVPGQVKLQEFTLMSWYTWSCVEQGQSVCSSLHQKHKCRFLKVSVVQTLASSLNFVWVQAQRYMPNQTSPLTDWECHVPKQGERATGKVCFLLFFFCIPLPDSSSHHPHPWGQDRWRRTGW